MTPLSSLIENFFYLHLVFQKSNSFQSNPLESKFHIENSSLYLTLRHRFEKVFEFLRNTDFSLLNPVSMN